MADTATMTRTDSFSRSLEHVYRGSLHKEVLYSAVNMSRKSSSDETDTPAGTGHFRRSRSRVFYDSHRTYHSPGASHALSVSPLNPKPLAPDRFYPKSICRGVDFSRSPERIPTDNSGQPKSDRKSNKTVNVNSCHSTIKNNNYLFVNNCRDIKEQSDQESLYRVYNVAEQTVTTTSPSSDPQKLIVDMRKDAKSNGHVPRQQHPKIVLTEQFTPVGDIQIFPLTKQELPSSQPRVVPQQNGHRKCPTQNGTTPNGHLRNDAKCSSPVSVSQNGNLRTGECLKSTPKSVSRDTEEPEKKSSSWWQRKFKTPCIGKHFIRPAKSTDQAFPTTFVRSSSTSHRQHKSAKPHTGCVEGGPHTSTPKYEDKKPIEQTTPSTYNSLPNRGKYSLTPRRPPERLSVRRKLPYTEAAVTSNSISNHHTVSTGDVNLDLMSLSSSERELLGSPSEERSGRGCQNAGKKNGFHSESRLEDGNSPPFQLAVQASKGAIQKKSFDEGVTKQRQLSLPEVRSINAGNATSLADSRKVSSEPSISSSNENQRMSEETKETPSRSRMEEAENISFQIPKYRTRDASMSSTSLWNSSISSVQQKKDAPVLLWLKELRVLTDNECLNALQGKVLCKDQGMHEALSVGAAQETAEMLKERCSMILNDIGRTAKALERSDWHHFRSCAVDLCTGVKDFLKDYCSASGNNDHSTHKGEGDITDACAQLMHAVNSKNDSALQEKENVILDLDSLKHSLLNLVDVLIMRQLTVIVDAVEESNNSNSLKRAIFALILLGQFGKTFCELIAKVGGIRALLSVCIENRWRHLHASALRALTVINCVPSAIKRLEESGGVECVADILCDSSADEATRSEAAGLMAQVTAPWMDSTGFTLTSITGNGSKLIQALTDLADHTRCSEVMLLASAALANLSFLDSSVCEWMKQHNTTSVLVSSCRQGKVANSLFIKDQVATVLANMAASSACQDEIDTSALILLLCFLQLRPSVAHSQPELAACERVQQKAAIALARLCSDVRTANTVAEMQGVQRLVRLCKDQKERNNSDSVLVACLAALRKIANVRGNEEFKSLGALELVEPRLWDTFLVYSSKQESYV